MYIFLIFCDIILIGGLIMEAYKPNKLPIEYNLSSELINLLCNAKEAYGEYKGFLKSMEYDYKNYLECAFVCDNFYSFKIDNVKMESEEMFLMPYKNKSNDSVIFNNMKSVLLNGVSIAHNDGYSLELFNKLNKLSLNDCSKNSKTKGAGHLRKIQTYILKPGIAGSSVSFIPPVHSELNASMKNLCSYMNENSDESFIASAITHFQLERLHPYITNNGKVGRLLLAMQSSFYKKEPPILFLSESIDNLKNTYFTLLSSEKDDIDSFIKFILECIIDQCNINIKRIKKLNKIYKTNLEQFKKVIGGSTIYKIYPYMTKKICFTTNDVVTECKLHINSVNKVLNKLVESGYLIKEKKKGTNRVTFTYNNMLDVFSK
jgi:Fic family protein